MGGKEIIEYEYTKTRATRSEHALRSSKGSMRSIRPWGGIGRATCKVEIQRARCTVRQRAIDTPRTVDAREREQEAWPVDVVGDLALAVLSSELTGKLDEHRP